MKAGLMKFAVDNPTPSDEEEDFKDLDGKADDIKDRGKDREASQYGKIKAGKIRKGAQRTDDSQEDYGVGISPDQNRGQATNKGDKRIPAQKVGKIQRPTKEDEDEDIPEEMNALLDEEVAYVKEFIEDEVVRRMKEIEDREDRDNETKKAYEEQKKKMNELEKKMKIIREKDERLKKYMIEQRSNVEKIRKDKKDRQNSDSPFTWKRPCSSRGCIT